MNSEKQTQRPPLHNLRCVILTGLLIVTGVSSCSFPSNPVYPSSFPHSSGELNDLIVSVGRDSGNSVSCSKIPVSDQASLSTVLNEYSNALEKYVSIEDHIVMNSTAIEADQYQYFKPITLTWDLVLEGNCDTQGPLYIPGDSKSKYTSRLDCPSCCVLSGDPLERKRFFLIHSDGPSSLTLKNLVFHRGGFGPEVLMKTDVAVAAKEDITIGGCALLRSIRNLKVQNVRFYDCMGFGGGAVGVYAKGYIDDPNNLVKTAHVWTNVVIRNSRVVGSGGGVLYEVDGHDGVVVFQDLDAVDTSAGYSRRFSDSFGDNFYNQTCSSKPLYPEGIGGAIAIRGDKLLLEESERRLKVTIQDCSFRNSLALVEISSEDECHVFGNPILSSGGAISLAAALQIDIENTSVANSQGTAVGGAIAITNQFSLVEAEPAVTIIRSSSFTNCSVTTALGGSAYVTSYYYDGLEVPLTNGGAVSVTGGFTQLINSSFSSCNSAGSGGAFSYYDGLCGYLISGYEEFGCKKEIIDAPHLFLGDNLHFQNNAAAISSKTNTWDSNLLYSHSDDIVVLPEIRIELCTDNNEEEDDSPSAQVRWQWNANTTQKIVLSDTPCSVDDFIAAVQAIFDEDDSTAMPKLDIMNPLSTNNTVGTKDKGIDPALALVYAIVALVGFTIATSIFVWNKQSQRKSAFGGKYEKENGALVSTKAELNGAFIHSGRDVILDAIDDFPDGDTTDIQELWASVIDKIEDRVGEITVIPQHELHYKQLLQTGTFKQETLCTWKGSDVTVGKIRFEMVFDVRSLEDLAQEITLLIRLSHPSLVRMFGVTENTPGIVLEHLKTGSLFAYRGDRDPFFFTPVLLVRIASQIAKGIRYLHSNRVIHFDIRCQNVLVDEDVQGIPHCKLSGLSLARRRHESKLIVTGGSRGTVSWMSPELFVASESDATVTEKADIFSFGITLWELWTGKVPYDGLSDFSIMDGVKAGVLRPHIPETCHPTWAALMQACWSTDPSARPDIATVDETLDYLLKTLS